MAAYSPKFETAVAVEGFCGDLVPVALQPTHITREEPGDHGEHHPSQSAGQLVPIKRETAARPARSIALVIDNAALAKSTSLEWPHWCGRRACNARTPTQAKEETMGGAG